MSASESLLKTQQVAKALGVSVSTVKRWVDSGSLMAVRTLGKHRLVPITEAIRFARTLNLPQKGLEELLEVEIPALMKVDDFTSAALFVALKNGDETESRAILFGAYAALGDAPRLADDVIRPAMEKIGQDWVVNELDVYQEHRACRIIESVLAELIAKLAKRPSIGAPLALGATPEGDFYTISNLLSELSLREMGWNVVNLGPNLPLLSLANAVRAYKPALIWLSINHLTDVDCFLRDYRLLYAASNEVHAAICLGGVALNASLRSRIMAASFGEKVGHLAEFARHLRSSPSRTQSDPTFNL